MSKLLTHLTQFYREESHGVPHSATLLWDLGWDLAEITEDYGYDDQVNVAALKRGDLVAIDTAVNVMHQNLLNSQAEDTDVMMTFGLGDLREYLLHRDDPVYFVEAERWQQEQDEQEARIARLEEEYWREMENLEVRGEWT